MEWCSLSRSSLRRGPQNGVPRVDPASDEGHGTVFPESIQPQMRATEQCSPESIQPQTRATERCSLSRSSLRRGPRNGVPRVDPASDEGHRTVFPESIQPQTRATEQCSLSRSSLRRGPQNGVPQVDPA